MTAEATTERIGLHWRGRNLAHGEGNAEPLSTGNSWLSMGGDRVVIYEKSVADPDGIDPVALTTATTPHEGGSLSSSVVAPSKSIPQTRHLRAVPEGRYILLKKYEGFVTEVGSKSFHTHLMESTGDHPVIEAEFDLEEISEQDRKRLVEGVHLVWTIGYRYHGSTRHRDSLIYLRNLPQWTDEELTEAAKRADTTTRAIKWE